MKKYFYLLLIVIVICSGCASNNHNVRRLAYPTSLYISKKDDEYEIALLLVNASSLSKIELESGRTTALTAIYSGKGKNFIDALNNINIEAKKNISMTYLKSLVISTSLLDEEELIFTLKTLFKSPKYRPTIFVYATDLDYKELYSVVPSFDSSAYFSLLNDPLGNDQFKNYPPLTIADILVRHRHDKMFSIPRIVVVEDNNYTDEGDAPKMIKTYDIEGFYYATYESNNFLSFIERSDLIGYRWMNNDNIVNYEISDDNTGFVVQINKARKKLRENTLTIDIDISLSNNISDIKIENILTTVKNVATKDILYTRNIGLENKIDIYFLANMLIDTNLLDSLNYQININCDMKIKYLNPL